jgi:hypothetical protein
LEENHPGGFGPSRPFRRTFPFHSYLHLVSILFDSDTCLRRAGAFAFVGPSFLHLSVPSTRCRQRSSFVDSDYVVFVFIIISTLPPSSALSHPPIPQRIPERKPHRKPHQNPRQKTPLRIPLDRGGGGGGGRGGRGGGGDLRREDAPGGGKSIEGGANAPTMWICKGSHA